LSSATRQTKEGIATMKIAPTFEIRVAVIGNVSAGKTTVLNALFRDKFGAVSMKRTTAAANYFHVYSKGTILKESENSNESDSPTSGPFAGWSVLPDEVADATSVLAKITTDNVELRQSKDVTERHFNIELDEELCEMHTHTKLAIIDIPGIDEAGTSKKYKDYVTDKWDTFDCAIVVMDGRQGVNTDSQVDLLKFVKEKLEHGKQIPIIILSNKVDDPDEEEQNELVHEARREVETIFNVEDREVALKALLSNTGDGQLPSSTFPVFLPISALNAFICRCASRMTMEQFQNFDFKLVEKIGREQIGRNSWRSLTKEQKIEKTYDVLQEPSRLQAAFEESNFDKFLVVLSNTIGGAETQVALVQKQIEVALKQVSLDQHDIVKNLRDIHDKSSVIAQEKDELLKSIPETFWTAVNKLVDEAFLQFTYTDKVGAFAEPMRQLIEYFEMTRSFDWKDEQLRSVAAMKEMIRRQMGIVFEKEKVSDGTCPTKLSVDKRDKTWETCSAFDWINIFGSFTLLSYDKTFCEVFGREKLLFDLLNQKATSMSSLLTQECGCVDGKGFGNTTYCSDCDYHLVKDEIETCPSCSHALTMDSIRCSSCTYCGHKYIIESPVIFAAVVKHKYVANRLEPVDSDKRNEYVGTEVPDELSNPKHLGHISWLFCNFMDSNKLALQASAAK
jgi:GTPase SAR1 family protein